MADLGQAPTLTVAPETARSAPGRSQRLRRHLAEPFFRNAYSLVLNTGVSGALGLVFWLLAARTYGDADVGRGSVTISLMTVLSGLVALNLSGTLTRFIGMSGRHTRRLVLGAYLLTAVAVAVLAAAFLFTLDLWGPSYAHLAGVTAGLLFTATVIAAAIATLQDAVLSGLRRAAWVPIGNAVFGIAKIVLLVVLATAHRRDGIYLSWVISMTVILIPVNALIFGWLIPRHHRAAPAGHVAPTRAQVGRFFAADYVGALCLFATLQFVPVMVATQVALHTFGYFYIAWTVGSLLIYVAVGMATSLTVEAAYDVRSISSNCRAAMTRTLGLLLVAAVTIALVAPYGLPLLSRGYADAAPLLQVLALAALPTAVTEIYLGVLRAQNATRRISQVQVVRGLLVLGTVFLSLWSETWFPDLSLLELTRVGLAVLISQTAVAAWVFPKLRHAMSPDQHLRTFHVCTADRGTAPADHVSASTEHLAAEAPAGTGADTSVSGVPVAAATPAAHRGRLLPAALGALTVAGVLLYALPLRDVDLEQLTGHGLLSVLPVASFVGAAVLAVAFLGALALPRAHRLLLGSQLVLMVLCLHGLPVVLESMPRFPTAWVHIGFIEFINRTGLPAPGLDARFSWPGFFALSAFWTDGREWQDLAWVVRLTPVVSNLLYLVPFALLTSNLCASWRARWLAAGLFAVLNWVGQDYFSPQGLAYLMYLVLLAVLVTWFRPADRDHVANCRLMRPWLIRIVAPFLARRSGELPSRPVGRWEQTWLLLFLVLLFTVTTASHQLTPFLMISACAGLVLVGRCTLRGLPLIMMVVVLAWISLMAAGYWSGHLEELLGGVGRITENVSQSVAGRAGASGAEHLDVLHVRMALAIEVGLLAAAGAWRRWRTGFDDRVVLVLLVAPGAALALQSYGGEMALRVYMFALPAACILIAYLVFPQFPGTLLRHRQLVGLLAAALCVPVLLGGFFVARYGNEAFEYVRPGEVAALDHVYENTSGSVTLMWPTSQPANLPTAAMVHGYRDMERVSTSAIQVFRDPDDVAPVIRTLREQGPGAMIYTTRSQEAELELAEGFPAGWGDRFRARMAAAPEISVVVANEDAAVYAITPAPAEKTTARTPAPVLSGVFIGGTPLTPVGVVTFVALVGILLAREFRSLGSRDGRSRGLRAVTLTALPLAIGFLVVVVERFVVLA